jgi:hypothetical protein
VGGGRKTRWRRCNVDGQETREKEERREDVRKEKRWTRTSGPTTMCCIR